MNAGKSCVRAALAVVLPFVLWTTTAAASSAVCAFSGPPHLVPRIGANVDFKTLGSPTYIRVVGIGGGGGGSGAGRAPNTGFGSSGSGGAGAQVAAYLYGPIDATTVLPVVLTSDGAGGCGGATVNSMCSNIPVGQAAPDDGQPGN